MEYPSYFLLTAYFKSIKITLLRVDNGNMKNASLAFDRFGYGAAISVGPTITAAWKDVDGADSEQYIAESLQAIERLKKNFQRYITIL